MSEQNFGPIRISFDGKSWEDVPAVKHQAIFVLSKDEATINPLVPIDIDDLRRLVRMAEGQLEDMREWGEEHHGDPTYLLPDDDESIAFVARMKAIVTD